MCIGETGGGSVGVREGKGGEGGREKRQDGYKRGGRDGER